jgi:Na+-driven multidrug efflux pump
LGILGKRFKIVRPPKGDRGPHWADIKRILDLAWPTSAQFVLRIGAMILVQSLIARAYTTADDQTATVAYGLVFRLDTMALFVSMGWGSAAQTFVGQNLGAQKESRANASGWITAAYSMATSVLLLILIMTSGRAILEIFVNTEKTPDTRPIDIALAYLGAVAPSYIALGIGVVLGNAMAGAGATRTTMLCDVAVILAFQFPVSVVAVAFYQIEMQNLFRLVAATNYLSAIVYAGVYARGRWRQNLAPPSVRSTPTPGTA